MPIPFKIKVTREILELSKECGTHNNMEIAGKNCAIALTLKDIFPDVFVSDHHIYPFGTDEQDPHDLKIAMPKIAVDFVKIFDALSAVHNLRTSLPEFEFEITIPDEVISEINIDEVRPSLVFDMEGI
jgi:hypothetical protein